MKVNLKEELIFNFQIINNSDEILKFLQIGTSIPILPGFYKYLVFDLSYFKAKSILLKENGSPAGNVLIYNDGSDVLYFGYFGVIGHKKNKIELLLDKLINYARENNFKIIRGPINIPAIIFGWGFMEEGSSENLYIGKNVNPPIYQELFLKNNFYIKYIEKTWEGPILYFNPWKLKMYNFNDYEPFIPKDWNELMELKAELLRLHSENLPPSATITPNVKDLFNNYADFIVTYGGLFMFNFVRYKPTGQIVASSCYLPNPFQKDTIVGYSWAVDPDHRRKGLVMLMYGATSLYTRKRKIRHCSGIVASDNIANTEVAKHIGLSVTKSYVILELKL